MLTNLLFINLFLHIIVFSWMKVEQNAYIYRLAIISLALAFASSVFDTFIFYKLLPSFKLETCSKASRHLCANDGYVPFAIT